MCDYMDWLSEFGVFIHSAFKSHLSVISMTGLGYLPVEGKQEYWSWGGDSAFSFLGSRDSHRGTSIGRGPLGMEECEFKASYDL